MGQNFQNEEWQLGNAKGEIGTWERVGIAVLMDIRRELRTLNRLLSCPHFTGMPHTLREIARNTKKRPTKKASRGRRP